MTPNATGPHLSPLTSHLSPFTSQIAPGLLAGWNPLKNEALQIFCFRQMRQNRVIQRLSKRFYDSQMPFRIDARFDHYLEQHRPRYMMGTRKSDEEPLVRKELQGTEVNLFVTAPSAVQRLA